MTSGRWMMKEWCGLEPRTPPLIYEAIGPLIMNRAGQGGPGKF
jgi:hypothetical protein